MKFKRTATIELAGHTVTLDIQDVERVKAGEWKTILGDQYQTKFYHNTVTTGQPVYEFLEHFILEAPHSRYVELIRRDVVNQFNFRRSNIRMRTT